MVSDKNALQHKAVIQLNKSFLKVILRNAYQCKLFHFHCIRIYNDTRRILHCYCTLHSHGSYAGSQNIHSHLKKIVILFHTSIITTHIFFHLDDAIITQSTMGDKRVIKLCFHHSKVQAFSLHLWCKSFLSAWIFYFYAISTVNYTMANVVLP